MNVHVYLKLRRDLARVIDPCAWKRLDEERKRFPADGIERFLETPDIVCSLRKADTVIKMVEAAQ